MKIILYEKNTIMINIVCILADIIGIYLVDSKCEVSMCLFIFSVVFNLLAKHKVKLKKKYIE